MADAIFENPRLARVYDPLDPDRTDLDAYVAIVDELSARSVLDIGCGTGTFACLLARRSIDVIAVDPAAASLDVARTKPDAPQVLWIHGDATTLPPMAVDMAVMTGNVAQVFTTDTHWTATLHGIAAALRPGGWLVFETRVPAMRAWKRWTPEHSRTLIDIEGVGVVESWHELVDVAGPLVTFRSVIKFHSEDLEIESHSTLRFRELDEIDASLRDAGYTLREVRDAPDRPGLEHVYLASHS